MIETLDGPKYRLVDKGSIVLSERLADGYRLSIPLSDSDDDTPDPAPPPPDDRAGFDPITEFYDTGGGEDNAGDDA